jgi:predicted helicase
MQTGYGILAFVTNHGYLDNPTFRGMRQALMQDFDDIYILDLHGNSKKKELSPDGSVDKNVFDIQQGVAIGIFVKTGQATASVARVHHAHLYGKRAAKYQYLLENSIKTTQWTELQPQSPFYLFVPQNTDLLAEYQQCYKITDIMPVNSTGMVSKRDSLAFQFEKESVKKIIKDIINLSEREIVEKYPLPSWDSRDGKVEYVKKSVTHFGVDEPRFIQALYRPFDKRWTYYTPSSKGFIAWSVYDVMQHMLLGENLGLFTTRKIDVGTFKHALVTQSITESHAVSLKEINYLFPLYLYHSEKDEFINGNGNGHKKAIERKPNFSDEFITELEARLNLSFISEGKGDFEKTISALDVFHYIYAVFHSPTYRTRYAEFLKMDFPRLPLTQNSLLFKQLSELGEQLVNIHLMNAHLEGDCYFPIKGSNVVEKIEYKTHRVYINKTQYFDNVELNVWEFHIGGYQVCQKWLKDRKGRMFDYDDCKHYLYILAALKQTTVLMQQVENILIFPMSM